MEGSVNKMLLHCAWWVLLHGCQCGMRCEEGEKIMGEFDNLLCGSVTHLLCNGEFLKQQNFSDLSN